MSCAEATRKALHEAVERAAGPGDGTTSDEGPGPSVTECLDDLKRFEEDQADLATMRQRRRLVTTAQALIVIVTIDLLAVSTTGLVLDPPLPSLAGFGVLLGAILAVLGLTWRWALDPELARRREPGVLAGLLERRRDTQL